MRTHKKWKVTGFLGGSKFCPLLQSIQWASSCSRSLHCQCYRQSNPSPGQSHHGKAVPISEPVNVTSQGKKDLEIGKFLWSFRVGGFQSQGCLEVKSLSQRQSEGDMRIGELSERYNITDFENGGRGQGTQVSSRS